MNKLGTIQHEEKACRAAFAAWPQATWAWCCHHVKHCEPLVEPAVNRIRFILSSKIESEQACRLRNFRPCKDAAAVKPAGDAYAAAVKPACAAFAAAVKTACDAHDAVVKTACDAVVKTACAAVVKPAYAAALKTAADAYAAALKTAADAYAAALKTADEPLRKLHNAEWPNNTWNGQSIF